MSEHISAAVCAALGRQLGLDATVISGQREDSLAQLGLDSHGLMRVLLDIEQQLGLTDIELPDDALESPATMIAGVVALCPE